MTKIRNTISPAATGFQALEKLNEVAAEMPVLFVLNENQKLVGIVTDGDIRRGLLRSLALSETVSAFMNTGFKYLNVDEWALSDVEKLKKADIKYLPLTNADGQLVRVVDLRKYKSLLPLDVIIMAGGRGQRLAPLTDTLPKPLLHVGDKPIIEHNIDRLRSYGITNFNISIRYLGDKIRSYFGDGSLKEIDINYIEETDPLGTIGAASLIESFKHNYVLLMNSDLLTNIDFDDFFHFMLANKGDMAIASVPYHVDVPYAILETTNEIEISSFHEKPRYTYFANGGIYLIRRELLSLLKHNEKFDATEFMELVKSRGHKLLAYPLYSYWLDIGKMDDYTRANEDIKHLNL